MTSEEYKIILDPVYGYRRLEPIPEEKEIARFYQSRYFDLIRKGGRAPDVRRLAAGGEQAKKESFWLRSTLYTDILVVLEEQSSLSAKRLLDIGCGQGEFIDYMEGQGWDVTGLEPSNESAALARDKGLKVYTSNVDEFSVEHPQYSSSFDVVTLLHVLEHVPKPIETLERIRSLLSPQGVAVIQVPNDFSQLQVSAQQQLQKPPWWIAIPDHINYFDFQSLHTLFERLDFELIYSQGDFPMEMFILMGDDYTGNPEVGNRCHQKRISFEMSITGDLRRNLYQALAKAGMGRNCLVFARLK